jgi:hypothetical protein
MVQLSSLGWRTRLNPPDALKPKVTVEAKLGGSDDVGGGS